MANVAVRFGGVAAHVVTVAVGFRKSGFCFSGLELTDGAWDYDKKDERCPEKGIFEPCDDSVTRSYTLPLDDYDKLFPTPPPPPTPPGPWVLGFENANCHQACSKHGMGLCSEPLLQSLTTLTKKKDALAAAGVSCTSFNGWDYSQGVSQCTSLGCCGGSCVDACSTPQTQGCSATSGHSRLCACEPCGGAGDPPCPATDQRVCTTTQAPATTLDACTSACSSHRLQRKGKRPIRSGP